MTQPPAPRFTLDGSDDLESHLSQVCDQVHLGLSTVIPPHRLKAIMLGGGYGRGEGGVLRTLQGDAPYDNLEFHVVTTGSAGLNQRRFRRRLQSLGKRLSPDAGLEVRFKVITLRQLRRSPPSISDYDLILGHRWIAGDEDLLRGCDQHRDPSRIPLHEATRLLMNRCTGLLDSVERLARPAFSEADADLVGHNLTGARLDFGDVYLAAHGQYHWSCRERHQRLLALAAQHAPAESSPGDAPPRLPNPWELSIAELVSHHAAGVESMLHPVQTAFSREDLTAQHAEVSHVGSKLWLWLEQRRLRTTFASTAAYAYSPIDKCPETSAIRNWLINLSLHGLQIPLGPKGTRHPRERLLNSLPLLLWDHPLKSDATLRRRLEWELRVRAKDFPGWIAAYRRLWNRFH